MAMKKRSHFKHPDVSESNVIEHVADPKAQSELIEEIKATADKLA